MGALSYLEGPLFLLLFDTMEARFHTLAVCPDFISQLFSRPTGLAGNALVS